MLPFAHLVKSSQKRQSMPTSSQSQERRRGAEHGLGVEQRPSYYARPAVIRPLVLAVSMLAIATAPVFAAGSQTTTAPPTPQTPPAVTFPTNESDTSKAVCAQQLNDLGFGLQSKSIDLGIASSSLSLGATAVGVATELTEIIFANPSPSLAWILEAAAGGTGLAGVLTSRDALGVAMKQAALPGCDAAFMGTISSVVNPLTGLYGG
jgi:hypothetical protein